MKRKIQFRELFKSTDKPHSADQRFVRLVFFNVGHGACTLISLPPVKEGGRRRYGVVDCNSPAGTSIVEYYLRHPPFPDEPPCRGDTLQLDFVVLTHFEYEHFKGMPYLLGEPGSPFRVLHFLGPPYDPAEVARKKFVHHSPPFEELCAIRQMAYCPTRRARRLGRAPAFDVFLHGVLYDWFDDVEIMSLAPLPDAVVRRKALEAEGNTASGALRFRFKTKHVLLLCGDAREIEWHEIGRHLSELNNDPLLADVVLVPCHGASTLPLAIWERASRLVPPMAEERREPTIAVISCRYLNPYTTHATYDLLARNRCVVYCTNPTRACVERHEQLVKRPSCLREPENPAEADRHLEPESAMGRESEDPLRTISEVAEPLAGSVCIDLRKGTSPSVRHIGRAEKKDCLAHWRKP